MLTFEVHRIGCDLTVMIASYKLTKRTTKTEKIEKSVKMWIINFKTVRYKLTVLSNTIH